MLRPSAVLQLSIPFTTSGSSTYFRHVLRDLTLAFYLKLAERSLQVHPFFQPHFLHTCHWPFNKARITLLAKSELGAEPASLIHVEQTPLTGNSHPQHRHLCFICLLLIVKYIKKEKEGILVDSFSFGNFATHKLTLTEGFFVAHLLQRVLGPPVNTVAA